MSAIEELKQTMGPHFAEYIAKMRGIWTTGDENLMPEAANEAMKQLLQNTPENEPWVQMLLVDKKRSAELYRDEEFGFIQMGHHHPLGHNSPPHDHGPHWVVYGVYSGEVEISTYRLDEAGNRLETLQTHRLTPGTAYAYLQGAIHSTREIGPQGSVVLRFLSADLKKISRSHYNWEMVVNS